MFIYDNNNKREDKLRSINEIYLKILQLKADEIDSMPSEDKLEFDMLSKSNFGVV